MHRVRFPVVGIAELYLDSCYSFNYTIMLFDLLSFQLLNAH